MTIASNRLHDNRTYNKPDTSPWRSQFDAIDPVYNYILPYFNFTKWYLLHSFASNQTRAIYWLLSISSAPHLCSAFVVVPVCINVLPRFSGLDMELELETATNECEFFFYFSFLLLFRFSRSYA